MGCGAGRRCYGWQGCVGRARLAGGRRSSCEQNFIYSSVALVGDIPECVLPTLPLCELCVEPFFGYDIHFDIPSPPSFLSLFSSFGTMYTKDFLLFLVYSFPSCMNFSKDM